MKRGRNINFYLMDGDANGKIKATITNWIGVAYKIPRAMLCECREFEAFSRSGVYLLFGTNCVYIGQAEVRSSGEALFRRVNEHIQDRLSEAWDEVVIFTTRDNILGRTDISFLEHYLFDRATQVSRYRVLNSNTPSPGTVTEEKRCELEEYADSAELILSMLGYKVFEPSATIRDTQITELPREPYLPPQLKLAHTVPPLPDGKLKIGEYVYQTLRNLGESGYEFSDEAIDMMCTSEWAVKTFHTGKPFMKRYIAGKTDNKGDDGLIRYLSDPFTFGRVKVYISKEWYERQRSYFIAWYHTL